jgi:hypothetical protein
MGVNDGLGRVVSRVAGETGTGLDRSVGSGILCMFAAS